MALQGRVRLAELVAALSLGIDLGFGQPMEHVLRQCLIASRIGERVGLDDEQRAVVYYTSLLVNVGCHTDAHEQARWFGDDLALKSTKYDYEFGGLRGGVAMLRRLGSGRPVLQRFRIGLEFLVSGHRDLDKMIEDHAAMARILAEELGLSDAVVAALGAAYEQWDGKGWPGNLKGESVPVASRISQLAEFVEVAHRVSGTDAAKRLARKRGGAQFDPALADLVEGDAELIFADLDNVNVWGAVVDAEPSLAITLSEDDFDGALAAIARFVDLKSPYFLGHASAASDLAASAGRETGMTGLEVTALRRAALVQGFGRLGVSNAIWDKNRPLGAAEWERVRMYPYLTERMLHQSRDLAGLGSIAVHVHERLDGSGYPRGLSGNEISRPARVLAAADAYRSMLEPRPHRGARSSVEAANELWADVRGGRLDADAVRGVLAVAGHPVPRRRQGSAGLTVREVEVLRLAARGLTNKDIGATLFITPKTVSNHIEHIYSKIGVSTRAMASMYAMKHGLLPEEEPVQG